MVLRKGIEPLFIGYQPIVLPLYDPSKLVGNIGFEPTQPKQQIYSLP